MSAVEAQAIAAWTSSSLSFATVPAASVAAWLLELGEPVGLLLPESPGRDNSCEKGTWMATATRAVAVCCCAECCRRRGGAVSPAAWLAPPGRVSGSAAQSLAFSSDVFSGSCKVGTFAFDP